MIEPESGEKLRVGEVYRISNTGYVVYFALTKKNSTFYIFKCDVNKTN